MKSTQAMRDRIRELMGREQDDYDRAVECVLDDLEAALRSTVPSPHAGVGEALEPFAKLAEFVSENHRDSRPIVHGLDLPILERLTIGHLRAAKAALAAPAVVGMDALVGNEKLRNEIQRYIFDGAARDISPYDTATSILLHIAAARPQAEEVGKAWTVSEETAAAIKEIDDNLRSARLNAGNIVAGTTLTPRADAGREDSKAILENCDNLHDLGFEGGWSSAIEACAKITENGCLVPPDGGSPTIEEKEMCDGIAKAIRALAVTRPDRGGGE